jgi:molybdopterin/thiamine biosynthesis adenylyltransferase
MTLSQKSALVIGAGGQGGPALLVLAAGGVGRLVVVDDDAVESSNLNRQPLFREEDLGRRKALVAAARLRALHPDLAVEGLDRRFTAADAERLASSVDLVVDGADNFTTKFLASDATLRVKKPLIHGGVLRTTAQILTIVPGQTGCLRCLFEAPPPPGQVPSCAEAGIVGALAGFAGSLMGSEALRLLKGERGAYAGRLFTHEARGARSRLVLVRRRVGCPACAGTQPLGDGAPAAAGAAGEAQPPAVEVTSSRPGGAA